VAEFVRWLKCFSITQVALPMKYDDLEAIIFDFANIIPAIRVIMFYRPPQRDSIANFADFLTEFATGSSRAADSTSLFVI